MSLTEANLFPDENHLKPFFKNSDVSKWFVNETPRSMVLYLQRDDAPTKYELAHLKNLDQFWTSDVELMPKRSLGGHCIGPEKWRCFPE